MREHDDDRMRVSLLGALEVRLGGAPVAVPGARLRALLTRIGAADGRPLDAGVLAEALWPQDGPSDPANALQSLVSRLRRVLGSADAVVQNDGGYRLGVEPADVDVLRFERLAAEGRQRLRAGDLERAATLLGEAMA
ncbi:AfsR/SARP family transcriptional regulator, partial [Dactylosporangium fulvum]|uniref:AfsR/SARP family transcriptional regulator n=1 Tax=Dactylosporangium fulvum TaxID=53359 RepID=UPI003CD07EFF